MNLLGNAVKFTREGWVRMSVDFSPPGKLRIDVEDSGPGIAPEKLSHIFEPFKQAEAGKASGGTGLGLGISRRLVELLGGELSAESEVGRGSRFTISLPVEEVAPGEPVEVDADSLGADREFRLAAGQEITILVADDSETNREMLVDFLKGAGFRTVEAANGEEALARLREASCPLVLMDIIMPVLDGIEATQSLRSDPELRETVVIAVSASVLRGGREEAIAAGFDDFISMPFKASELFQKIERHLGVRYGEAEETVRDDEVAVAAPDTPLLPEEAGEFATRLRTAADEGAFDAVEEVGDELRAAGRADWAEKVVRHAREFDFDGLEKLIAELEVAANQDG